MSLSLKYTFQKLLQPILLKSHYMSWTLDPASLKRGNHVPTYSWKVLLPWKKWILDLGGQPYS